MAILTAGAALNFDIWSMGTQLGSHEITSYSSTFASATGGGVTSNFWGQFVYDGAGNLVGGTLNQFTQTSGGVVLINLQNVALPVAELAVAILQNSNLNSLSAFNGADVIQGSPYNDVLRSQGGEDVIYGGGGADILDGGTGADTVFGGLGDDRIFGGSQRSYLRGEEGDDILVGGEDFDDLHGNTGNDTLEGRGGGDWVVGGKDQDLLYGGQGSDIVYGNLGNDTCYGDDGNDIVRGGQNDDVLFGGAGDDWLSGDRHSDTISGGTGADIFHTFGDAGVDRVLDFSRTEGDRVQLDPGTTYSVAQVGADTVISMGGGAQMTLVGVSMASLTDGWIFI